MRAREKFLLAPLVFREALLLQTATISLTEPETDLLPYLFRLNNVLIVVRDLTHRPSAGRRLLCSMATVQRTPHGLSVTIKSPSTNIFSFTR